MVVLPSGGQYKVSPVNGFQKIWTGYRVDDMYSDPFASAFTQALAHNPFGRDQDIRYRVYQVCKFAEMSLRAKGGFLFAGVAYGVAPRALKSYLGERCRKLILVDPYDSLEPKYQAKPLVLDNSELITRRIPEGLSGIKENSLAFILLNTGEPGAEIASLPMLFAALQPGGVMLINAYGGKRENAENYKAATDALPGTSINLLNGTCAVFA